MVVLAEMIGAVSVRGPSRLSGNCRYSPLGVEDGADLETPSPSYAMRSQGRCAGVFHVEKLVKERLERLQHCLIDHDHGDDSYAQG